MFDRFDLVRLVYRCPRDIAVKLGYDKLTDLHNEWIIDMVFGEEDETLQAHRGSFKTTCIIIAFAFICTLFPNERTIFLRKTDADVAEVMKATANVLKDPYFIAISYQLFGVPIEVTKDTQGEINTNLALGVSGASQIVGLGSGASITGKHADRLFTDDIINVKDRVSAAERERIKLLYQELQNVRNRGGRIFNTGTPWHKDDAFTLMPNIKRFDCYSTGLMTREEIQTVRKSMSPSLFAANYELKHIADVDAIFKEPAFFSDPRMLYDGLGHIDASYGGEDGTAFTAMAYRDGRFYAYIRLWQKHVDDCLPQILMLCGALRIGTIYCERNADKGYVEKEILKSHPAFGYQESTNKYIKISTFLKNAWGQMNILDCDDYPLDAEALCQVLDYNENAAHDDMPDSMASLTRVFGTQTQFKGFKGGL